VPGILPGYHPATALERKKMMGFAIDTQLCYDTKQQPENLPGEITSRLRGVFQAGASGWYDDLE
jgi:hypothetical protein